MVVDRIMLDKSTDKQGQARRCSDCGCNFSPPQTESKTHVADSQPPPTIRQRRLQKARGPSKCRSCEGRPTHSKRLRPEPHQCPLCTKTFISSSHLALHITSHSKERKHKCGICGKYFNQSSHLMAHKKIHSGDRPFKCPDCGKTFGRASHLKTHQRLHTGEKPFKCTFCNKAFTQKAGLMAHVPVHTRERPFKCERCGETFRSLPRLISHKSQESSKQIGSVSDDDQNTHGNPEDLKCGICCRTFVRSSYLRLYVRLKNGQRPYHCKVCNKTFVKMDTFVNHCEKHLRKKNVKSERAEEKVVKPSSFIPLSGPSASPSSVAPLASSEVNTRSRARAKTKLET
ncbi:zinc finger protein 436 [Lampris incognitus]|uniref:zinc finger protein 436 n=1 Tax=Lampris incognitus TaxID=2546036 RepID=UPI0024B611FB|nr:zinc finger protein 436 [Lampris incognitus]